MDLYSAKSMSVTYDRVKKDNLEFVSLFPKPSDFVDLLLLIGQKLSSNEYTKETTNHKEELLEPAKTMLMSPNLIDIMDSIQRRATQDPLIDSEEDLLQFNLVIVSCKTQKPYTYEVSGPTATGKTFPAEHAVAGFPPSMISDPAGVTGKAGKYDVDYIDDDGNRINKTGDKCFYFREKEDSMEAVKLFKQFMSHDKDKLTFQVTSKNMVTGENEAINYIMDGIPSFILLSVKHMDNEEMSSRTKKNSPTTSKIKTKRVVASKFETDTISEIWKPPKELKILHNAMANLQKKQIVNIFGDVLKKIFPYDDMRRARDADRLRGLIMACTVLHQYQRCYKQSDEDQLLYTSLDDILVSLILTDETLESTILGVEKLTLRILKIMKEMQDSDIPLNDDNIHERIEAQKIFMTMETLETNHIDVLLNHTFIRVKKGGSRSTKKSYRINDRYIDLLKVPKLTPLFIEELQRSYQDIIEKHVDDFVNFNTPECKIPENTINYKTNHKSKVIKYLFGVHYFNENIKKNILWKITSKKIRRMLFNKHILNQSPINIKESKDIEKRKEEVTEKIISGESVKEDEMYDRLAKDYEKEQLKEHEENIKK